MPGGQAKEAEMGSKVVPLHRGRFYTADWIRGEHGGLCVMRNRPGKHQLRGVLIPQESASAESYRQAIETEDDPDIRERLCRACLPLDR